MSKAEREPSMHGDWQPFSPRVVDFDSEYFRRATEQVKQFTEAIFGVPATCCRIEDAEIAGDYYMEVQVQGVDNAESLIAQDQEWIRRLASLPAGLASSFVLAIHLRST